MCKLCFEVLMRQYNIPTIFILLMMISTRKYTFARIVITLLAKEGTFMMKVITL